MSFRTALVLGLSALRSVRYLLGGHVRFPQTRLGNVLETTDGETFIVYRETALQSTHASASDDGVVVVFRMEVPGREAGETLREVLFDPFANVATPFFAGMPGFERKLWLAGERPGEFLELYEWATIEDANRFVDALGSLLEPFDFAGTASFEIVEDDTIDEYVAAHAVSWREQDRDDTPRRERAGGTSIWTVIPFYQEIEEMCDVSPAPVTAKEELFFRGAAKAGWDLLDGLNVTEPGYRPQPNAISQPDQKLHVEREYDGDFTYPDVEGDTLALGDIAGNPHPRGAPYEQKAKRASNVSFVPAALRTGNVTIRPNAFVTDVRTDTPLGDAPVATGVRFRDTWSGSTETVDAEVVILAAGAIETPRLWLNADLPDNEWVGRGLTIHFGDNVMGLWEADDIEGILGKETVDQHQGQDIAVRFDYPGLGMLQTVGTAPGIGAILGFGASASGFALENDPADAPWDTIGRLAGTELKRVLSKYRQMLQILVVSDDRPHKRNGVSVSPGLEDEHGPIPLVNFEPSASDRKRRDELAEIAAEILREAGASHVHRSDSPPTALHVHSTMRMGKVVDEACEAYDVDRLFVADHSALANGVGGANPTNTGQALAARTADRIVERYF